MIDLKNIRSIYFIGIGGIGMSGLARYFNSRGVQVSGYDKTQTHLIDELVNEGMKIHFEENVELIPKNVDLVCFTPAVSKEHAELKFYVQNKYNVVKRSDLLEELTKDLFTIAVAGSHGKTTTSTLIAHILKSSGYDCSAFLGGVSANYNSNFLIGKNKTVVVEADEYDRSFWKLHPDISVITSVDPDHLDVYGTVEEFENGFIGFARKLKTNGTLFVKNNVTIIDELKNLSPNKYSLEEFNSNFYADDIELNNELYSFTFHTPVSEIKNLTLGIPGLHNVENAVAACAVAWQLGIGDEEIRKALATFKGVKRRFEIIYRSAKTIYIDDYAHHPNEINAFLSSIKKIFPDKKLTCVFQPHLFSRTRDFADEFAESLSIADTCILLPIYPARELPIEGINSEMILEKVTSAKRILCGMPMLLECIRIQKPELLVTIGAGDIDTMVSPIKSFLTTQSLFLK